MWQCKILAVSWLCMFWTKIDSNLAADVSTPKYPESTAAPMKTDQHVGDLSFGNLEATKTYTPDPTIRSFFPIRGKQKWMRRGYPPVEEMLFFNVSMVNDNEEVSLAELHIHRRRIAKIHGSYHKRFLPLPYRVVLYQVQTNYRQKINRDSKTMKLASIPVSYTTKSGWHTLDVTAALRELLINAQGPTELLLGVQFEAPRGIAKSYMPLVPLKHFLKSPDNSGTDYPHKSSSYLIVFSDIDPYFEEFEDRDEGFSPNESDNDIPDGHVFKERHLKHKIFKVKSNDVSEEIKKKKDKVPGKESKEKIKKKYKAIENEVYKTDYGHRKEDVVRHKSKHKTFDVKRSKADELALHQKNKLKSLPFLHTNEVEEIRQTSRRLTRSVPAGNEGYASGNQIPDMPGRVPTRKEIRRILNNLIKEVTDSQSRNESLENSCTNRSVTIRLSDVDFGVKVALPAEIVTTYCSGRCLDSEVSPTAERKTCMPGSRRGMDFAYYDKSGKMTFVQLRNFLVTDCQCR